ncbi:MAG: penicillin-insensitive murein endopeptidase [Deltaproteobacteria bacterium]
MIRILALLLAIGGPALAETPARDLFGAVSLPTTGKDLPIGSYAKGCQSGAVELPESGATWQAMRLSRNRHWGQPELVDFIVNLSKSAAKQKGWAGIYVGDMSQPRGGPMKTGHASHQIGLDVDIWMLAPKRLDLSAREREEISAERVDKTSGAYATSKFTPELMGVIKAAALDKNTARIFLFPGGKVALCAAETGNRDWLRKIRPWYGHNDHFHVRLKCPKNAKGCVDQDPPPPGDGCQDAQDWVDNILNPPPPDPNAKPGKPAPPLVLADLPKACKAVVEAE